MLLVPITTFESPEVAPKLLTFSVSVPLLEAVTVKAAAMPLGLPVLVGALELTLMVFVPAPPVTVVGLLIDWMLMMSFRPLPVIEIESPDDKLPVAVLLRTEENPCSAAAAVTLMVTPEPVSLNVYF